MKITRKELAGISSHIQSLIDIDTFFEEWDNVKIWKEEKAKADALLATDEEIFEI